jgi:hypothetical protein
MPSVRVLNSPQTLPNVLQTPVSELDVSKICDDIMNKCEKLENRYNYQKNIFHAVRILFIDIMALVEEIRDHELKHEIMRRIRSELRGNHIGVNGKAVNDVNEIILRLVSYIVRRDRSAAKYYKKTLECAFKYNVTSATMSVFFDDPNEWVEQQKNNLL